MYLDLYYIYCLMYDIVYDIYTYLYTCVHIYIHIYNILESPWTSSCCGGCSFYLGKLTQIWITLKNPLFPGESKLYKWMKKTNIYYMYYIYTGWWFGTFFPYIGNNNPNWLIFFRGVETTNQYIYIHGGFYSPQVNFLWPRLWSFFQSPVERDSGWSKTFLVLKGTSWPGPRFSGVAWSVQELDLCLEVGQNQFFGKLGMPGSRVYPRNNDFIREQLGTRW